MFDFSQISGRIDQRRGVLEVRQKEIAPPRVAGLSAAASAAAAAAADNVVTVLDR